MHQRMRNISGLKIIRCAARLIDLNEYLAAFLWAKAGEKMFETELNEIFLNIMLNSSIKQAYVQGFYC